MINRFTIAFAHMAQICNPYLSLPLSIFKILPKAVVHTKKTTLVGAFDLHMIFQGKECSLVIAGNQKMVIITNLKALFLTWFSAHLILPNPPNYQTINGIHEGHQGLQSPILYGQYKVQIPVKHSISIILVKFNAVYSFKRKFTIS